VWISAVGHLVLSMAGKIVRFEKQRGCVLGEASARSLVCTVKLASL
jgi:hypothetical protein